MEFLRGGERVANPPILEQMATILEHYQAMLSHYGIETGLKIARKHLGWYSKGLPGSAEFRTRVNQIGDPRLVMEAVRAFYEPLADRPLADLAIPDVTQSAPSDADELEAA
jgi:tRNA-dihydrouridine synthase B